MLFSLSQNMVVLMNLDESGVKDPPDKPSCLRNTSHHAGCEGEHKSGESESNEEDGSPTLNFTSTFSAALSCYP